MQTVTFKKAFTIEVDAATTLTYPEGWTGPVDDDVAVEAEKEGCIEGKVKAAKKGKAADAEPVADADTPPA